MRWCERSMGSGSSGALETGSGGLEAGSGEAGSGELEAGSGRLETGSERLETGSGALEAEAEVEVEVEAILWGQNSSKRCRKMGYVYVMATLNYTIARKCIKAGPVVGPRHSSFGSMR